MKQETLHSEHSKFGQIKTRRKEVKKKRNRQLVLGVLHGKQTVKWILTFVTIIKRRHSRHIDQHSKLLWPKIRWCKGRKQTTFQQTWQSTVYTSSDRRHTTWKIKMTERGLSFRTRKHGALLVHIFTKTSEMIRRGRRWPPTHSICDQESVLATKKPLAVSRTERASPNSWDKEAEALQNKAKGW